jgi:HEAT repeat protein
MNSGWLLRLDQSLSSYSLLAGLLLAVLAIGLLYESGFIGWVLALFGRFTRAAIRLGFHIWERWLSWADWWVYLLLTGAILFVGARLAHAIPEVTLLCGLATLVMGMVACLAYMFIDIERYEVERGYRAVHNPTKGQELAPNVARYGHRVGIALLAAATAGAIGGFTLLNQGLYETIGRDWYRVDEASRPGFPEFLTYTLINLLSIVDVLDLADSHRLVHTTFVRKAAWPTATLLAGFRLFFTMILLQQVFASVRQGRLLAETITDFWSPHPPIHERALSSLPQFGGAAIAPLLLSLREMTALTKEQRDRLPQVIAAMGPASIPILIRHLRDSHEHVRAVTAGALGQLRARDAVPELAALVVDTSGLVRLSAVEALGSIVVAGPRAERSRRLRLRPTYRVRNRLFWRQAAPMVDHTAIAKTALRQALADELAAVRCQAASSLGQAGDPTGGVAEVLAKLLEDADEEVRCRAAEALGQVGGDATLLLNALDDPAAPVRAAAARGLKALGRNAAVAVSKLVDHLQDRDEAVRAAAADAVAAAGPLDGDSATKLTAGLTNPDNVVRAQAAEALGAIGAPAEQAVPALVEALQDGNDVVRAKAVEALGKIGETAAEAAVPSLVRALHDRDSWVSAMAAEALGEMGGVGEGVLPGLIRALNHVNPLVRANSAEALGKLGPAAAAARTTLLRAGTDEDGSVRAQALRALGNLGPPNPATLQFALAATADADPLVRAAAAETIGTWHLPEEEGIIKLLPLLRDPNDQVKVQVAEVLAKYAGNTAPVVEGLCQVLAEDDSTWVQASAAQALGRLGAQAVAAGAALLRAARTGVIEVREQAMRALVMIQPPEAVEAFEAGLADSAAEVRVVASAGWVKAAHVPDSVGPGLVGALTDPETQVRANVAYAIARLDNLPLESISLLRECASDPNDGLRLNAAVALRRAPDGDVADLMSHLLNDPNVRIRLVAAGAILGKNPADAAAGAVVLAAMEDPTPRVRLAAEELVALLPPTIPAPDTSTDSNRSATETREVASPTV